MYVAFKEGNVPPEENRKCSTYHWSMYGMYLTTFEIKVRDNVIAFFKTMEMYTRNFPQDSVCM